MRVSNLNSIEYSAYFKSFIKKATDVELLDGLMQNKKDTISFFKSIPEFKLDFAYDSGKWTVKQLLLHLIDVERIFVYRALSIARNDNTPLLSFDENLYATESQAEMYTIDQLLKSYQILRAYTINLFEFVIGEFPLLVRTFHPGTLINCFRIISSRIISCPSPRTPLFLSS